jgi:hypothetical protein
MKKSDIVNTLMSVAALVMTAALFWTQTSRDDARAVLNALADLQQRVSRIEGKLDK